jgi:hypothetical protein
LVYKYSFFDGAKKRWHYDQIVSIKNSFCEKKIAEMLQGTP